MASSLIDEAAWIQLDKYLAFPSMVHPFKQVWMHKLRYRTLWLHLKRRDVTQAPEAQEEPAAEEQPAEGTAEESKDEEGGGGEEEPEEEEEPKPEINVRHCLPPMPKQHLVDRDTGSPRIDKGLKGVLFKVQREMEERMQEIDVEVCPLTALDNALHHCIVSSVT